MVKFKINRRKIGPLEKSRYHFDDGGRGFAGFSQSASGIDIHS